MTRASRPSSRATLASLTALVVLAMVLQTSAPAALAGSHAHDPIPRAAQPRVEMARRVIALRPAARPAHAFADYLTPTHVPARLVPSDGPHTPAPRDAASRGLLDLPPPSLA